MLQIRRRRYIIKKEFQYPSIAAFSVVSISGIAMAVAALYHSVGMGLEQGMYRGHIPVTGTAQIVMPIAVRTNLLFVLCGVVVLGVVSFYFARKTQLMVDGFKKGLVMLRQGRFDFEFDHEESRHCFPELEEAFNKMVADNRARLEMLEKATAGLDGPMKSLRAGAGRDAGKAAAAIEELGLGVAELSRAVGRFRL